MADCTVDPAAVVATLQTRVGRIVPALDAILEILQQNLPVAMAELDPSGVLFQPDTYPRWYTYAQTYLGEKAAANQWPKVLIAASVRTSEFGMGHENVASVLITYAHGAEMTQAQRKVSLDICVVIAGILRQPQFMGPVFDPDTPTPRTRMLWNQLFPTGYQPVPSDWKEYSGHIATFELHQTPGPAVNLW